MSVATGASAVASGAGNCSAAMTNRLQKELMDLVMNPPPDVSAFPVSDADITSWNATIVGPKSTVYEGLEFKLSIKFPAEYPHKAPTVRFTTPLFHPNVDTHGNICLDILKENWTSTYDTRAILLSIQSLLNDPNNKSPLNEEAARLWIHKSEFKTKLLAMYNTQPKSADRSTKN